MASSENTVVVASLVLGAILGYAASLLGFGVWGLLVFFSLAFGLPQIHLYYAGGNDISGFLRRH